ncbi:MAG: hypothetical protein ACOY94_02100 [Bacillota bacterium]
MNRSEAMERIKFLYDQVHQTAERQEHLQERMPLHVQPQSLNYHKDLSRIQGEYNRMVQFVQTEGLLSRSDLEAEGLPLRFED